jgi:hypothetical protein
MAAIRTAVLDGARAIALVHVAGWPDPDDDPGRTGALLLIYLVAAAWGRGHGRDPGRRDQGARRPGAKLIPGLEAARTQDFLMILSASTPFLGPDELVAFVTAASRPATALPRLVFRVGPRRLFAVAGALRRALVPVASLATTTFHSALPVRWGDYAGKYRLVPGLHAAPLAPSGPPGPDHLADDLARRLAAGPLRWEFAVQLYRDPTITPIEDPTVSWPDDAAPPVVVARLTIDRVDLTSEPAQQVARRIEELSFDPWHALVEHRPLGALMRARNHAYRLSTVERGAASEPDGSEAR